MGNIEHEARIGQILGGRYRLERRLSSGSITELYQATDLIALRRCTIKIVAPHADARLRPQHLFQREARIVPRLSHPQIMSGRAFSEHLHGEHIMVMEPLSGSNLHSFLVENGPLPLALVLRIVRALSNALQHAHDLGIVHADLKPSSIFLIDTNVDPQLRILDFGLAKLLHEADAAALPAPSLPGLIVRAPAYAAPEALQADDAAIDARSDQWSLAIIACQLLCGRLPFQHDDPLQLGAMVRELPPLPLAQLLPDVPAPIRKVLERAMSKNKADRFCIIADFGRALEAASRRPRERYAAPTIKAIRTDLIELCRRGIDAPEAVIEPLRVDDQPRRYAIPVAKRRENHDHASC